MRKLLTIILVLFTTNFYSQTCTTTVSYDYMELYTWFGNWNTIFNTGFYNNASISPTLSGVLYGAGNGTSALESANYVLPNITGLNASYTYKFRFRLASYRFSNPTAATAGVDGPDYVDVRYSTNNGTTYTTEMRIAGNANAYWDYNTLATASKVANGVITTYAPVAGGNRTSTGDGYSIIELTLTGVTQLAFQLSCRVNSNGEEWWIDNVELLEIAPCLPLPIELISFTGNLTEDNSVLLKWITETEINNDYFLAEKSLDGINWSLVSKVQSVGNSLNRINYSTIDNSPITGVNYYRLSQVDYNGQRESFNIISIELTDDMKKCSNIFYDLMGREIDITTAPTGIYLQKCNKGYKKIIKQ